MADDWNLAAAILCTLGALLGTAALYLLFTSEPNLVNLLAAIGAGISVLGGVAWIIAAEEEPGQGGPRGAEANKAQADRLAVNTLPLIRIFTSRNSRVPLTARPRPVLPNRSRQAPSAVWELGHVK
jgi:hypothetical protein